MEAIAIVGLGSRGLSVLERIVTLADRPVRVHVIDPTGTGAGVHDPGQPDYLLLNTTCGQVSMFPDRHTVDRPAVGPTLYDWVTARGLRVAPDGFTLGRSGRPVRPTDFLPRRVLGDYLAWFHQELLRRAAGRVSVVAHRAWAVDIAETPDGLRVSLSDGSTVDCTGAFLTTGYVGAAADAPYPLPARVESVHPGQSVAVAGFGLSAMDLMASLTVGRGGRFVDGRYLPSGREPTLLFYSRSGVPCRARPRVLEFGPPHLPVAFTPAAVDALRATKGGPLDFAGDLMPLVYAEMRAAWTGGPGFDPAAEFDGAAALDGAGAMALRDAAAYQDWLAGTIRRDLAEGEKGLAGSPVKAALDVLRVLRDTFRYAVDFGGLSDASLDDFYLRIVPAVNRAVVGPQFERHEELLALFEAGIAAAPFGPAPALTRDPDGAGWTLASTRLAVPCARRVDRVLPARVPLPPVASSTSELVAALYRKGWLRPHRPGSAVVHGADVDRDMHPVDVSGRPSRRLWMIGPLCEGAVFYTNLVPSPGSFSRPVHDADRCVRAALALLAEPGGSRRVEGQPAGST